MPLPSCLLLLIRGNNYLDRISEFLDTQIPIMVFKILCGARKIRGKSMIKNSKVFDIIVLAGMVVNIILAVFLILYYFDFL